MYVRRKMNLGLLLWSEEKAVKLLKLIEVNTPLLWFAFGERSDHMWGPGCHGHQNITRNNSWYVTLFYMELINKYQLAALFWEVYTLTSCDYENNGRPSQSSVEVRTNLGSWEIPMARWNFLRVWFRRSGIDLEMCFPIQFPSMT